jgi:diguanylate cyclase (GGDEF)-like protein
MSRRPLRLEEFPDSPYATELCRGATIKPFAPPLEAEYTAAHLQRVRWRLRLWHSLSAFIAVIFSVAEILRVGIGAFLAWVHLGLLLPIALTLVAIAWSRAYQRYYLPVANATMPVFVGLVAAFIAMSMARGHVEQLSVLTVNLVGLFFFTGLFYRAALVATAAAFLSFVCTAIIVSLPLDVLLKSVVVMSLTSGVAGLIYFDVEKTYRISFLEGALLTELGTRDGLTGLMNRRAFDEHLLRVWKQALREQRVLGVLMIDIDDFKEYNDTHGHQAGDEALSHVARAIQAYSRRPLDMAARYGGEEFAVILYDLPAEHVTDLAERLRQNVASIAGSPTVSVGAGIAVPTLGRTPQGLVLMADQALYEAKRAGRNRVVFKGVHEYQAQATGAFTAARLRRSQFY